jgi:hypothetical protein
MKSSTGVLTLTHLEDVRDISKGMPERSQMKHKTMIGLYFFAGGLTIIVALRDIFAPGLFAMSGRVNSTGYILVEFAIAITFLVLGAFFVRRGPQWHRK